MLTDGRYAEIARSQHHAEEREEKRMEFSNRDYISEHGKNPRGYGMWAFATKRNPDESDIFWFTGSLTEAKKAAKEHFKGAYIVYVLA